MPSVEKPKPSAEKATHTIVDTIGFTVKEAQAWEIPQDIQIKENGAQENDHEG